MISNEGIADFTIESFELGLAFGVLGALHHEAKVNGDALVADSSTLGIILAAVGFAKLGAGTDGTSVQFGSNGKIGNTNNKAMKVGGPSGVEMAKPLMPKNAKLIATESVDNRVGWDARGTRSVRVVVGMSEISKGFRRQGGRVSTGNTEWKRSCRRGSLTSTVGDSTCDGIGFFSSTDRDLTLRECGTTIGTLAIGWGSWEDEGIRKQESIDPFEAKELVLRGATAVVKSKGTVGAKTRDGGVTIAVAILGHDIRRENRGREGWGVVTPFHGVTNSVLGRDSDVANMSGPMGTVISHAKGWGL